MLGKVVTFDSGKQGVVVSVSPTLDALICSYAPIDDVLRGTLVIVACTELTIISVETFTIMIEGDGTQEEIEEHNAIITELAIFLTEFDLINTISPFLKERMGV